MNKLARLVGRGHTVIAAQRALPLVPSLRRHVHQKPTPEALYEEYLKSRETPPDLHELQNHPELEPPEPVSFEVFQHILAQTNLDPSIPPPEDPADEKLDPDLTNSGLTALLTEMQANNPDFLKEVDALADNLNDVLHPRIKDQTFEDRLAALEVEHTPEQEVAWRVAQLVLSTEDKSDIERIEDKLATYDGPLSTLNVAVEWYLQHPEQIEREEQRLESEMAQLRAREAPQGLLDALHARQYHDNNDYYYQLTPIDELVRHLRNRDVQYAIKKRMDWRDRQELFKLLDSIVTPVLNEDMTIFNAIAALFAKHEDVHLVFRTEPRLPRLRRLEVFKRLIPLPEEDQELPDPRKDEEIKEIVEETKRELQAVQAEKAARRQPWPDLMTRDPLMDSREVLEFPPTKETPFHNRVVIRNHHSIFTEALEADGFDFKNPDYEPTKSDEVEQVSGTATQNLPIDMSQVDTLIHIPVIDTMSRLQTSKGNKDRHVQVRIVGDGNGMVGLGFGKHAEMDTAASKATADAVRNMDWVERFEDRTIWTEVRTKFGATTVILRPRPVGFGLRCNPYVHQLLKAAGIKDISAKVWGSRNKVNVLKATLRLLHAGHAPISMGDGVGGPARKMWKGVGLRNKNQIERARGRRLIDLRV